MTIPNFQTLMLPLLRIAGDRQEHSFKDAIPFLAKKFGLTEEEKKELLPSGKQSKFNNRVYWTKTHLLKAGLLSSDRRGAFEITEEGLSVLAANPSLINTKFLERYEKYCKFRTPTKKKQKYIPEATEKETPEKALKAAHQKIQENLSKSILESIKQCSPYFFEHLVVDLLISMGYGGSRKEAGQALKRSQDEGIDGIIKEDRLGFDIIYIQAKRWSNNVSKSEIQKFAGALLDRGVRKGIFLTTSDFSQGAIDYLTHIDSKIIPIDGNKLTELMIEYDVGVMPIAKYEIKKFDSDYFIED